MGDTTGGKKRQIIEGRCSLRYVRCILFWTNLLTHPPTHTRQALSRRAFFVRLLVLVDIVSLASHLRSVDLEHCAWARCKHVRKLQHYDLTSWGLDSSFILEKGKHRRTLPETRKMPDASDDRGDEIKFKRKLLPPPHCCAMTTAPDRDVTTAPLPLRYS